jgi:hypothetical protein
MQCRKPKGMLRDDVAKCGQPSPAMATVVRQGHMLTTLITLLTHASNKNHVLANQP